MIYQLITLTINNNMMSFIEKIDPDRLHQPRRESFENADIYIEYFQDEKKATENIK